MGGISLGTTDIKICARALVNVGMNPIDTLDDDGTVSSTCNLMYPMVKKEVLGLYDWYATEGKFQLSRLTDTPVNEYRYAFQMPADRLSGALAIYNSGAVDAVPVTQWRPMGDLILSNYESIWGDFNFDLDESKFPIYIENLIIYILSARLAEILTEDSSKADKYDFIAFGTPAEKRWGGYFEIARSIDSRARPNKNILPQNFDLVNVRGS